MRRHDLGPLHVQAGHGFSRALRVGMSTVAAMLLGCGGASGPPGPVPASGERRGDPTSGETLVTDMPVDLPDRLELEYRRRTADGDDMVLKLTPAGARYGLAHGKARVALRYQLPADALASTYAALRREGCDRLQSEPREAPAMGGTSLRLSTGTAVYTVSAMGQHTPAHTDAQAYARCVAAMEERLPTGRSDVVVLLRWHASMADQSAGLDVDVGPDLVGLHRVADAERDASTLALHLARARPLQLQLRWVGAAARSTTLTLQAGVERGVEVAFDAERGEVIARPLPAEPAAMP
jgi:hypothetical protein